MQSIRYCRDLLCFWSHTSLSGRLNFNLAGDLNLKPTQISHFGEIEVLNSPVKCAVWTLVQWFYLNCDKDDIYRFCYYCCHNLHVHLPSLLLVLDSFSQSPYLLCVPALDAYMEAFCLFFKRRFNHHLISRKKLVAPSYNCMQIMITTYWKSGPHCYHRLLQVR